MTQQLIVPEALQQTARDILWRLGNLGEQWFAAGINKFVQDGEHLEYSWDERENVVYWRSGQGRDKANGRYPELELRHVHVPKFGEIYKGESRPVGVPQKETKVSQSVDLYPGDSTKLSISDSFTDTVSEVEATKIAIQNAAKLRFGATTTPVGAELSSQVTNELSKQSTTTSTHTSTIASDVTVVNNTDKPFRVHLEAVRTSQKVQYDAMIDAAFDFVIVWRPWQAGFKVRVEGLREATWGSLEQFYSSMAGLEPSSVGNLSGWYSLSDRARGNPQGRPAPRILKLPYTVEYDDAVVSDVNQVREAI